VGLWCRLWRRASVWVRVADRVVPVVGPAGEAAWAGVDSFVAQHGARLARLARHVLAGSYGSREVVFGVGADGTLAVLQGADPGLPDGLRDDVWGIVSEGSPYSVVVRLGPAWQVRVQFAYAGSWDASAETASCQAPASGGFFGYAPYSGGFPDGATDTHWSYTTYDYTPTDC
jgi:hypothetical protein